MELARRAEEVAQGLELEYAERRRERSERCLPTSSQMLIQSLIQTPHQNIHYQNQGILRVINAMRQFCRRRLSRIQTHHATPTKTSSGTPVRDMMCLASSPTGRIVPRSRRP